MFQCSFTLCPKFLPQVQFLTHSESEVSDNNFLKPLYSYILTRRSLFFSRTPTYHKYIIESSRSSLMIYITTVSLAATDYYLLLIHLDNTIQVDHLVVTCASLQYVNLLQVDLQFPNRKKKNDSLTCYVSNVTSIFPFCVSK